MADLVSHCKTVPARSGASSSRQSSSGSMRDSAPAWQIWSSLWILILLASSSGSRSSSIGARPCTSQKDYSGSVRMHDASTPC